MATTLPPPVHHDPATMSINQLREALGAYLAIEQATEYVGGFRIIDIEALHSRLGNLGDLRELGNKYFDRLEDALYRVLCGDQADSKLFQRLRTGVKETALAAPMIIAKHIQEQLGIRDEIATYLAWILFRSFAKGGHDDLCKEWSDARKRRK